MKKLITLACQASNGLTVILNWLSSIVTLIIRLYVSHIFFLFGWTKLTAWTHTLKFFKHRYHLGFLPYETVACLVTGIEVVFPILLILGIGARLPALGLLTLLGINGLYPNLLGYDLTNARLWAALLGIILCYGPGKLSIDHILQTKICKEYQY